MTRLTPPDAARLKVGSNARARAHSPRCAFKVSVSPTRRGDQSQDGRLNRANAHTHSLCARDGCAGRFPSVRAALPAGVGRVDVGQAAPLLLGRPVPRRRRLATEGRFAPSSQPSALQAQTPKRNSQQRPSSSCSVFRTQGLPSPDHQENPSARRGPPRQAGAASRPGPRAERGRARQGPLGPPPPLGRGPPGLLAGRGQAEQLLLEPDRPGGHRVLVGQEGVEPARVRLNHAARLLKPVGKQGRSAVGRKPLNSSCSCLLSFLVWTRSSNPILK